METSTKSRIQEYTELTRAIRKIEAELSQEQVAQAQLQQEIENHYERLKSEFAKRWPPLTIKQV